MISRISSAILLLSICAMHGWAQTPAPAAAKQRFKFQAYDGDPKNPAAMDFQVNPLNPGARTQFVKIGHVIDGTRYKVTKFELKKKTNPQTGEQTDISELTLTQIDTKATLVLPLDTVVEVK